MTPAAVVAPALTNCRRLSDNQDLGVISRMVCLPVLLLFIIDHQYRPEKEPLNPLFLLTNRHYPQLITSRRIDPGEFPYNSPLAARSRNAQFLMGLIQMGRGAASGRIY